MLQIWFDTLTAVVLVSLVSLVGIFTLSLKMEFLKKILLFLVSLSAGTLLGGAFFHLIPEAVKTDGFTALTALYILSGMIVFLVLERIIHWRHCHVPTSAEHPHPFALMNLVGDSFHNFLDGMLIAGTFLVSAPLGISTTLAIILHEIPQEIGDFGVLVHGGYARGRALLLNFLSALLAVAGAALVLILNNQVTHISAFLVPFTAGAFIYIASADLIPEMKKEETTSKAFLQIFVLTLGLVLMLGLTALK